MAGKYKFKNAIIYKPKRDLDKIAVIDIGSNSVRLVIYDGLKRTPLPIFNEKVLSGLAKGMNNGGYLNASGADSAERAIKRFVALAKNMGVKKVTALATSAVRDAKDGKEFASRIKKKYKLKVKVISGEEEARLSSLGILESIFEPEGVVGDLGGGSLELSYIKSGQWYKDKPEKSTIIGGYKSFPLGPLRLKSVTKGDAGKSLQIIDKALLGWQPLKEWQGKTFYAVGGGFRALAKIHMTRTKYPLRVLHNYEVNAAEFLKTVEAVRRMPLKRLKELGYISSNRIETLHNTALITSRIITHLNPKKLAFSVHGIREGYLYDSLGKDGRAEDPLLAGAADMIEHITTDAKGTWIKFGYELYEWMSGLFQGEPENIAKLRLAACLLSRLAWNEHTEYRAEMAYRMVLDSALSGISHKERVFIATAVFHRYKTNFDDLNLIKPLSLVDPGMAERARAIGTAMRLGINISGGGIGVLKKTTLSKDKTRLKLSLKSGTKNLVGESLEKRLDKLAEILGLKPAID